MVDEVDWARLASTATFDTYHRHLTRSFIELSPNLKWCPNPAGCDRVVQYDGTRKDLMCQCGHSFCFACGMEAHEPAACDQCVVLGPVTEPAACDATSINFVHSGLVVTAAS